MSCITPKPTKSPVRPAKTQISLGIRPVWSESSLCSQWEVKDQRFLHADSKDSDQTGWMPRLIWVFAGRTGHFVGFVMRQLIWICSCLILTSSFTKSVRSHLCCITACFLFQNSRNRVPIIHVVDHMSHIMRKPVSALCEQQRRRSACTSVQSDHTFVVRCLDSIIPILAQCKISKTLASLCSWAGRFESYLVCTPGQHKWKDHIVLVQQASKTRYDSNFTQFLIFCVWTGWHWAFTFCLYDKCPLLLGHLISY